jgi:hypothetical protein
VQQYIITIDGGAFTDFDEVELPQLPDDGDPLETKYGTCVVVGTEILPDDRRYDGKIFCRLP